MLADAVRHSWSLRGETSALRHALGCVRSATWRHEVLDLLNDESRSQAEGYSKDVYGAKPVQSCDGLAKTGLILDLPLDPAKGLQRVLGLPLDPAKGLQRLLQHI